MKKLTNVVYAILFGFIIFNFFIKNSAEADVKRSYESYLSGEAVFIDVREENEVRDGMIKGAIWIPLSKISSNKEKEIIKIKEIATDKKIFVYCRSGSRSGRVQEYLKEAGVKSINMGGYSGLVSENLPTQIGPK
jgi:rhodanese-related sulfurtransferase